ncbi:clan AA aspartic protease, AF_0612 family [Thermanaeromonas toyohensis ToBE]|uniref:Clan AA aspartic protease, AF_0612 family n=1 Tax=Thermanaeromonas toyohensis ToBE TaxID=698762 RepID=A0A1W1VF60_9FIRM|nr:retroviral-like aspartic protease family protein [Thermanaeromonas toyohensis]SMB91946.1 clan AA aspartic protease, AF_0612 family [Thermanaeromonas toyohensis ToBE]
MGLTYVTVKLTALSENGEQIQSYEDNFLVDTGATDTVTPSDKLQAAGIKPVGKMVFELAKGRLQEYQYGLTRIEFIGEITAGRVVFGPPGCEPLLGVTALESVGILVDPVNKTLRRLPAIPLKFLSR